MANEDIVSIVILVLGIIIISTMAGVSGSVIVKQMAEKITSAFVLAIILISVIGTVLVVIGIIKLLNGFSRKY